MPGDTHKPPKAGHPAGEGGEGRRSKYVVLQQSINIIKSLQLRVAAQEEELRRLRASDAAAPVSRTPGGSAPRHAAAPASAAASGASAHTSTLADVPASSTPGVSVHPGSEAGTCYVRVSCADRRGLLADILNALRAMPLEVVRAAITTSTEGYVNDVFELRCAPDAAGAAQASEDIKRAVERQLLASADADGKRRKLRAAAGAGGAPHA